MTTDIHLEDGGPCEGIVFCAVVYEIEGQRPNSPPSVIAATDSLSAGPAETTDQYPGGESRDGFFVRVRRLLERILPGF
jgi:hypothetical protein